MVVTLAEETEVASLYYDAQEISPLKFAIEELSHKQSATLL